MGVLVPTIKAIETGYAGCRFRSRLEARWAVFFDTLGVAWQYEPQGFEIGGHRYLPDFYLPTLDTWYEVKGRPPTDFEGQLATGLANGTGKDVVIAYGDIPLVDPYAYCYCTYDDMQGIEIFYASEGWDGWQAWCICECCLAIGVQFEGRADRNHGEGSTCPNAKKDRGHNAADPRIIAAYNAARSARFEHGQHG